MKTITKIMALMLLSCAMLFDLPAQAQFTHFPTYGAPISGQASVSHGLLQDLDQRTSPIWFKVNGNIVGPQPHNKMHPYVTAGSQVQVNFNINRNNSNRYTMVTYQVQDDGERILYDYHSDHFNQVPPSPPYIGNSNQQLVLVPTCRFEIYFIKGALSTGWNGPAPALGVYDPTTDAANPYTNDLDNVIPASKENRIIDFAYGGPNNECNDCPAVLTSSNPEECVYPRLLEVISIGADDDPNGQKELIFSVANTINSVNNTCGTGWPEIGDIMFTNITPLHTGNNQPYFFRWNYQLGPQIQNYPAPPLTLAQMTNVYGMDATDKANYSSAFVFDQRNNHNNWDFNIYQSDIVRFKISNAEYDQLNLGNKTSQICIELSPKHPEPHTSLEPIHCFDLVFNCEVGEPCVEYESTSGDILVQVVEEFENDASNNFIIPLRIFNNSTDQVTSISVTHGAPSLLIPTAPILAPTTGPYVNGFTWAATNDGVSTVTFAGGAGTAGFVDGAGANFEITVNADDFSFTTGGVLEIVVNTATGSETIIVEAAECAIIVPLPVELLTFTGAPSSAGVDLKWVTASEKNNARFEIERSADGKNFERIGDMKGKGTTSARSDYKYTDKGALKGLNYYRLRQVDFDGSHEYSQIIKVNSEKGALSLGIKLVPNPCSEMDCSVLLQGVDAAKGLVVEMRDLTGRVVFTQQVAADQTSFNLPKANLGKGVYILSAKNGMDVTYQRVIIQ